MSRRASPHFFSLPLAKLFSSMQLVSDILLGNRRSKKRESIRRYEDFFLYLEMSRAVITYGLPYMRCGTRNTKVMYSQKEGGKEGWSWREYFISETDLTTCFKCSIAASILLRRKYQEKKERTRQNTHMPFWRIIRRRWKKNTHLRHPS